MKKTISLLVSIFILILSCKKEAVKLEPVMDPPNPLRIYSIADLQVKDTTVFVYDHANNIIATNTWYRGDIVASTEWYYAGSRLDSVLQYGTFGNPFQYGLMYSYSYNYDSLDKLSAISAISIKLSWDNDIFPTGIGYNYSGKISALETTAGYDKFVYASDNVVVDSVYTNYNSVEFAHKIDVAYDDKINPFFGKYPVLQYNSQYTTQNLQYLSRNNVTVAKVTGTTNSIILISYLYNTYNYPVRVDRTVGNTHSIYIYDYEPRE